MPHGRHQRGDAVQEQRPVRENREQEIGRGSGKQHGYALRNRTLVECPAFVGFGYGPLAGVQEAYVTTERNR